MSKEPMFNLREKAPLILFTILFILHILRIAAPENFQDILRPWIYLFSLDIEGLSTPQRLISLIGSGFVHVDFNHVIMNGFMIIAFGIVTIQAIRADIRIKPYILSPVQKFYIIFFVGVIGAGLFQWGWWSIDNSIAAAIGASGGGSALFATMAYAIGGRDRMLKFGLGWLVINLLLATVGAELGANIAWAGHIGGYVVGMIMARYWVRPSSANFKLN